MPPKREVGVALAAILDYRNVPNSMKISINDVERLESLSLVGKRILIILLSLLNFGPKVKIGKPEVGLWRKTAPSLYNF